MIYLRCLDIVLNTNLLKLKKFRGVELLVFLNYLTKTASGDYHRLKLFPNVIITKRLLIFEVHTEGGDGSAGL